MECMKKSEDITATVCAELSNHEVRGVAALATESL
jgi:hypothetical protein